MVYYHCGRRCLSMFATWIRPFYTNSIRPRAIADCVFYFTHFIILMRPEDMYSYCWHSSVAGRPQAKPRSTQHSNAPKTFNINWWGHEKVELKVTTFSVNKWAKSESDTATHILYILKKANEDRTWSDSSIQDKQQEKSREGKLFSRNGLVHILYFGGAAARKNTYICMCSLLQIGKWCGR